MTKKNKNVVDDDSSDEDEFNKFQKSMFKSPPPPQIITQDEETPRGYNQYGGSTTTGSREQPSGTTTMTRGSGGTGTASASRPARSLGCWKSCRTCCKNFKWSSLFDTTWKRYAWAGFAVAIVITGISLLATSLEKVESTEYGLQYNIHSKVR